MGEKKIIRILKKNTRYTYNSNVFLKASLVQWNQARNLKSSGEF